MPVHPHHCAEGLEPEGIGKAAKQLIAAIMMHDSLAHDGAEPGHAVRQPGRHAATMQRQIGISGTSGHRHLVLTDRGGVKATLVYKPATRPYLPLAAAINKDIARRTGDL